MECEFFIEFFAFDDDSGFIVLHDSVIDFFTFCFEYVAGVFGLDFER